jgi:hypothetical protein
VDTSNISRDDWILGGVSLLLVIDLLFLPWFSIGGGSVGTISIPSVDLTATGDPDGWLGILAVLFTIALIADLAIDRLSPQTQLPSISGGRAQTRFVLASLAAFFVVLKFLFHIHFSLFGFGFYAAVVLTIAMVYLALQARSGAGVGAPGAV